jgi:hypothetical protein
MVVEVMVEVSRLLQCESVHYFCPQPRTCKQILLEGEDMVVFRLFFILYFICNIAITLRLHAINE